MPKWTKEMERIKQSIPDYGCKDSYDRYVKKWDKIIKGLKNAKPMSEL